MNHMDHCAEIINDVFPFIGDDVLTQKCPKETRRHAGASTSVCSASDMLNATLVISTLAASLSMAAFVEATSAKRALRPLSKSQP